MNFDQYYTTLAATAPAGEHREAHRRTWEAAQADVARMKCARTACQSPLEPGHTFFNRSTRQLYCGRCARLLNEASQADAQRLYGGPLCILVETPPDATCPKCGGSGGGPDPALTCSACGGSGRAVR